ncbi:hypothetical protein ACFSVM_08830 [Paenibacillus shunpengii]|uniref:Uncharacterized protein n=1 Tax=Paenibacillus shunpengii TaxID=2054424 RepID=A0ABW5SMY9_9BACL
MDVVVFVLVNVMLGVGITIGFVYLRKLRNLIGYHLGMNISMTISTVSALSLGALWGFQFPQYSGWVTILATIAAMLIGLIFGTLVDYQTIVTGMTSGMMAGLMGPMIVLHSNTPVPLLLFCLFLFFFSIIMLCSSVKV